MGKITKGVTDKEVVRMMDIFQEAYTRSMKDMNRLQELQDMYDNTINLETWPTTSKIPIPLLFTSVEKALGPSLAYLFPDSKFIRLVPLERDVPIDMIEKSERLLENVVRYQTRLHHEAIRTVKDCFKLSVGYGIIEPYFVSIPTVRTRQVRQGGEIIASARTLEMGEPKRTVRYRYVNPGRIFTTMDGVDFNGENTPSVSFFIDFYKEEELRRMYSDPVADEEDVTLKGNVEQIINDARSHSFDSRVPAVNIIAKLGGVDALMQTRANKNIPVLIPVMKCYMANRHVWIANGRTIIFDEADKYQTMRCPLVKASCWPDGDRWYPMSQSEASSKLNIGVNIWVNAMFDLLTRVVKPALVYDKQTTGNRPPEIGPSSDIGVTGDVNRAMRYLDAPQMPQGLFAMGDILQSFFGNAVGQENFMSNPSPGLVRGGANAFESLLQSTTGREQLAGVILESGFVDPSIRQILLLMQTMIDDSGYVIRERKWNKQTGKEYIESMTVLPNDLVHAYDLSLNLRAKHRNSSIDGAQRQAEFSVLKDDPYIDQYELRRRLINDEDAFDRLMIPRDEARAIEEQRRQSMQEQEQAVETPEAQGLRGAAAIGGSL